MRRSARSGTWPGLLLAVGLCLAVGQAPAAPALTWSESVYNPQPQPDDLILPLPCGGAMAFRAVATPGREAGYAVTGPFERADGTPYLLLGKYEVNGLQAQALGAQATGGACPKPQATLQTPQVGDWWEAQEVADRYSLWLAANADSIPACDQGAAPCLPRVDEVPAYLRLPTDTEWEYAARGGLSVPAGAFAGSRYPMPQGLAAHAWYAANARGTLQPIGGRAASPLGLHDLYGNAAEWVLGSDGPFAVAVGGHANSPETELGAEWRRALPPFAADPGARTGLRLLASVPLFTTNEKVREAERRHLVQPVPVAEVQSSAPTAAPVASVPTPTSAPAPVVPRNPLEPEMIALAGGEFWMGSPLGEAERFPDEGPRHKVQIRPFSIGKYAVTFAQYDAFAEATGRAKPGDAGWGRYDAFAEATGRAKPGDAGWGRDQRPVINVGWGDAVAYTQWLSAQTGDAYRLPSEAEWEYAARAGTETPFSTGPCINTGEANYDGNIVYSGCSAKTGVYRGKTLPVGSLPANPQGLHEVHGNLWEWVQDRYHDTYTRAPADGSAWEGGGSSARVSRGGSWFNGPRYLRSAVRSGNEPGDGNDKHGFRLAKNAADGAGGRVNPAAAPPKDAGVSGSVAVPGSSGRPSNSTERTSKPRLLESGLPFEPPMIALPGGEFWMGSPEGEAERRAYEGPRHLVHLAPFAIGKTEVTFAQYDRFCEATRRVKPSDHGWGRRDRPVIDVTWDDAVAYTVWLSKKTGRPYRLPSEAEWEYAVRAGTQTPFSTGGCINTDQANYSGNADYNDCGAKTGVYRKRTVPVASLPANPWGLHEVHGNVWEWVQDYYHDTYTGAPEDGSAWEVGNSSLRVVRGGSWYYKPWSLRSANRGRVDTGSRDNDLGFRVARTLSP